jgi:type II secretory pathway component PulJ
MINKNKAFTLVEILVTTALFVSIFSILSGLFFSALKVQRRSLSFQTLIKESSYTMEYMSRQLRMAQKSESGNDCTSPPDLKNYLVIVDAGGNNSIKFRNYADECWTFFLDVNTNRLKVNRNGVEDFLTSAGLNVLSFKINLSGDVLTEDPNYQPRVTLMLEVEGIGQKAEEKSSIKVQTTVSQRNLDI